MRWACLAKVICLGEFALTDTQLSKLRLEVKGRGRARVPTALGPTSDSLRRCSAGLPASRHS